MNWLPPIRWVAPPAMAVFSVVFAAGIYLTMSHRAAEHVREYQEELARHAVDQLSGSLREALDAGDEEAARRRLQQISMVPNLRSAYLLDERNRIELAFDASTGSAARNAVAILPTDGLLAEARRSRVGRTRHAGDILWAVHPLDLPVAGKDQAGVRAGVLALKFDNSTLLSAAKHTALKNTFYIFCIALAIGIVLVVYLHLAIVRRVEKLSGAIKSWKPGREVVALSGRDELADLSFQFSKLAVQLTERNTYLQTLFQRSFQLAGLLSPKGKLLEVNDYALDIIGAKRADVVSRNFWDTPWWNHDRAVQGQLIEDISAAAAGEHVLRKVTHYGVDGEPHIIDMSLRPIKDSGGEVKWLLAEGHDITPLIKAEQRSNRLNSFYATLSHTNSTIVRAQSEHELLERICNIIVEHSDITAAWIGLLDAESGAVDPVVSTGMDPEYMTGISFSVDGSLPQGQGPVGRAIREGVHQVSNDFMRDLGGLADEHWMNKARRAGLRSAASFPLFRGGEAVGVLTLYAEEKSLFTEGLIKLLDEMADDVSFALDNFQRQKQLTLLAKVFDSAHEVIVILDRDRSIVSVNKAFTDTTGYEAEEVIGRPGGTLRPEGMDEEYLAQMVIEIQNRGFWQGEVWFRRKNGEVYPSLYSISAITDDAGDITNYVCVSSDISEHKETQERARFLAYNDSLTGLPNRMLLCDRAEQAFHSADRGGTEVGLMFLDLDQFKHINESLGHGIGDALLKEVAKRLSSTLRESDTIGRMGGDEFLVILPDTDANEIAHIARDLLDQFSYPFDVRGHVLSITASAGITVFPHDGETFNQLHQHADVAMYKAKELGRNRYHFFTSELNSAATDRLILENALRTAVDHDELSLHYQPQIDIASGNVAGFEALLRWTHPKLGAIPPDQFIAIAEDTGMIEKIGAWVMLEACRECKRWQSQGLQKPTVAVNVSFKQFVMGDMYEAVKEALRQSQLDPTCLEIEITESLLAIDIEETLKTLNQISGLGVRIAVDDFGTGYSSLSYLKRYPLDKLKIDQSFIGDIATDKDDFEIAAGIINLGHSLALSVVAEGVEAAEQLELLRHLGCDGAQGYFFSRPLPADNVTDYLKKASYRAKPSVLPSNSIS